ncbi:MAG: phosphoenolpyruvate synthase [Bacteroidetes bacterium]|nr:MAG: phosphoenolpyruvate synthase [Bacteroidota bacterium]
MNETKELNEIGGKATSLFRLKDAGFRVPPFVVFTEDEIINLKASDLELKLKPIRDSKYFAVRSSGNLEDGSQHSFAGIFTTELYVPQNDLALAIQRVFAAKQTKTVDTYLAINSIPSKQLKLAIIVQEMVPAEVSGVAFGIDPTRPFIPSKIVSSVYGLGEGIVSGELDADTYTFENHEWTSSIITKDRKLYYDGKALIYKSVDQNLQEISSLNPTQLEELNTTLDKLEKLYGRPQDVEFCYVNNELFILQSRPITALKKYKTHTIWDNSNIIESYPGITLPFTFSFILAIYESVYKSFGLLLGVPKKQIEANNEVFAEMLGHINGRVYYHLIHWYKALAMLPAYEINAAYMENMMGVSEPLGVDFELKAKPSKLGSYWNLIKTLVKILVLNRRLPKVKKQFTQRVNKVISDYKSIDYTGVEGKQIWSDYKSFKSILVNEWSPPLANDLLAMIYFGTLQKLCSKWLGKEQLHTELVVGKHPVKSVLPAQLIQEIIQTAEDEDHLKTIQSSNEKDIWKRCQNNQFGETGKLISKYIQLYGDRSVGELKLENETYTQNPVSFITILKSYNKPLTSRSRQKKAEENELTEGLSFFKKIVFNHVSKKAAEMVADRENLRFDRTLGFGTVRMFLWKIGERLVADGKLNTLEDIFYLKEEELDEYIKDKLQKDVVLTLIANRRIEFDAYKDSPSLPERIHQYDDDLDIKYDTTVHEGQLKGIPCCAGEVTGKVRILSKPQDIKSLEGDILVTTSTDPGWITIFQSASAILVERGSTLSHAAIVSREMGIPCIVGIKGLTQNLKDGDYISMNGTTGLVEHYEEK